MQQDSMLLTKKVNEYVHTLLSPSSVTLTSSYLKVSEYSNYS